MSEPRHTLEELLEKMDPEIQRSEEEQAWLDLEPVGREILPDEEESGDICDLSEIGSLSDRERHQAASTEKEQTN